MLIVVVLVLQKQEEQVPPLRTFKTKNWHFGARHMGEPRNALRGIAVKIHLPHKPSPPAMTPPLPKGEVFYLLFI
jgi:hypothetical protein